MNGGPPGEDAGKAQERMAERSGGDAGDYQGGVTGGGGEGLSRKRYQRDP